MLVLKFTDQSRFQRNISKNESNLETKKSQFTKSIIDKGGTLER